MFRVCPILPKPILYFARCVRFPEKKINIGELGVNRIRNPKMFNRIEFQVDPNRYVQKLMKICEDKPNDVDALADLAEGLFEFGEAQEALKVIQAILSIDHFANENYRVFLWAGQLFGGSTGLEFYDFALELMRKQSEGKSPEEREEIKQQMTQTLLGMIEIWMTDLCMEPEAESKCEKLISNAIELTDEDPEVWSVLGSIRLSQLKHFEARQALSKSWTFFIRALERSAVDNSVIPKLIRLAQSLIETMQLDLVLQVTAAIQALDDSVPECHYLNALAHNLSLKPDQNPVESSIHIISIRDSVEALEKIEKSEPGLVDPELLKAATDIRDELPEPAYENPWELLESALNANNSDDENENNSHNDNTNESTDQAQSEN